MSDFFISDTHFGHKAIIRFERTQFATIEEHDNYIIEKVNQTVKVSDTLYILGDVGNLEKVRLLNGRKILVLGNHDKMSKKIYEGYFAEVYEMPFYYNKRVLLSHIPEPVDKHILNVHGHLHGAVLNSDNHYNVSLALIGFTPVSEKDLQRIISRLPKQNYKFLEEWYADMYRFSDLSRTDVVFDDTGLIDLPASIKYRKTLFNKGDEK